MIRRMRILLVSQMYPSAAEPDFGVFVQALERELAARGHAIERVVLDRRGGGKLRHLGLAQRAVRAARRFRPDVVYAHFLFPTGLAGVLAARAPARRSSSPRTARTWRTLTQSAVRRRPTRLVVRRAATVIAVSDWLRGQLEQGVPDARGKTEVVNCGVDLERFRPLARAGGQGPAFLCVGSLIERKNVVRLARAFERLGEGTLTFVGDGPLRGELEGRPGVDGHGRTSRTTRCPASSPRRTCSASRASSSRSARRRSRRWPAREASSRPASAARRSSFRPAPASSSIRSTKTSSPRRSAQRPRYRCRTRPPGRRRAARRQAQAERVEAILERAVRGRRA